MTRYLTRTMIAALIATGAAAPQAFAQADEQELGENTVRYEDDAWYDVSEWLDGNDYNPTDEAIGRWDEEVYDSLDAVRSDDEDNDVDWNENDYGYYANNNNNDDDSWFYDYSRYGYSDWYDDDEVTADDDLATYDYSAQYYDYDADGLYEAFASFRDTDGDGAYESMTYYSFNESDPSATSPDSQQSANRQAAAQDQKTRRAEKVSLNGKVASTKEVKTPQGKNLVVRLQNTNVDKQYVVDLGPVNELQAKPKQNDQITAAGPALEVGKYNVLLAQQATIGGQQMTIDRGEREYTGKVIGMQTAEVRGEQHQLVKLQREDGKSLMVALGKKNNLQTSITNGATLTVTGPAVKVQDRRLLMADSFTLNGKTRSINRQR